MMDLDEAEAAIEAMPDDMTWADARRIVDEMSEFLEVWEGIPVPIDDDSPLVLRPGHRMAAFFEHTVDDGLRDDEKVVNQWVSRRRNTQVWVVDRGGVRSALVLPLSPDRSMERLAMWMQTLGAVQAWGLDAEYKAREVLRGMLTEHQWRHYDMTGAFLESSPRSHLTYLFRRLRPTVALSPRGTDGDATSMRCIAVLCLHPIGYYANSWAGCMVPTDDVIAALSWMRADEAGWWGKAVHHHPHEPEAGL